MFKRCLQVSLESTITPIYLNSTDSCISSPRSFRDPSIILALLVNVFCVHYGPEEIARPLQVPRKRRQLWTAPCNPRYYCFSCNARVYQSLSLEG